MIPFAIPLALKTLPWKWIGIGAGVLAVLLALWALYSAIYDAGAASVQKKWDDAVRASEAARIVAERENRRREQNLYDTIAASKQEQADAEAALDTARRRIDDLLRHRPASVPGSTEATTDDQGRCWATGAQLYQDHGQFLEREAGRADRLRLALRQCYAQYDAAVKAVNP